MRYIALAALLTACGGHANGPPEIVVVPVITTDVGISTALRHTLFAADLGCTAVSVGAGLVVTAKHCVDELEPGESTSVGFLVFQDPELDYAIMYSLDRATNPVVRLRAPVFGEHVYAVGYPMQLATKRQELTVTDGLVAGPGDDEGNIRITAPIYFGNSGGGCWGADGALVGITVNGFLQMPGMNYIVPADKIDQKLP